ncbi:hypothetical protein EX30DRAFT_343773 [Ascodesmis nigricans]|uniref:Uncharacterized protein n=1 Tax=Ascodesmis nigricans TaxID=341454 RepID=A0A4S2MRS9_9PEZI|nr:hypothetical protein EX30DRAFT_343773 [Ascodesmis nigricans]
MITTTTPIVLSRGPGASPSPPTFNPHSSQPTPQHFSPHHTPKPQLPSPITIGQKF